MNGVVEKEKFMKRFNQMSYEEKEVFMDGANYARAYIDFCATHYIYELNLGGINQFMRDMIDFSRGANYIPNVEKITFKEFIERYIHKL